MSGESAARNWLKRRHLKLKIFEKTAAMTDITILHDEPSSYSDPQNSDVAEVGAAANENKAYSDALDRLAAELAQVAKLDQDRKK